MPTNADIFLQLNKEISKEKRKKKIWRAFFFVFMFLSFIGGSYIAYIELFDPPFGKLAALHQENEELKKQYSEMETIHQRYISKLDSINKVNDLLLENSAYYTGVFFEVQIGAFSKLDLSPYEDELEQLRIDKNLGLNKYTLGKFRNFNRASSFMAEIRKMGITDAFIVGKIDGERVDLKAAKKASLRARQKF